MDFLNWDFDGIDDLILHVHWFSDCCLTEFKFDS